MESHRQGRYRTVKAEAMVLNTSSTKDIEFTEDTLNDPQTFAVYLDDHKIFMILM